VSFELPAVFRRARIPEPRGVHHAVARTVAPAAESMATPEDLPVSVPATAERPEPVRRPLVTVDELEDEPTSEQSDEQLHRHERRLALIGELASVAMFVLVLASAMVMARFEVSGLVIHVAAMTAWAFAGALVGLPLGFVRSTTNTTVQRNRVTLGAGLLFAELVCLTGLLACAGGIAGPFWLVFLPLVLLSAAAVSSEAGIVVGALAAAGVYVASIISHTVDTASVGRLVVVLPILPVVGYVGSAVGGAARRAAEEARQERENLERDLAALVDVLDEVALGDLSHLPAVPSDSPPATATLAVALADTVVALRRVARGIQSGGAHLAEEANGLMGMSAQLAAGAAQQASSVTEVTTTVEQLAATSSQIAETAQAVSRFAADTLRFADEGQQAVEASTAAMDSIAARVDAITARADLLAERTDHIDRNLRVIDDLAVQTNMLAFNAAIEAARAGSHGTGFSVVAGEIRKLAERAREATGRVEEIVDEIRQETQRTRAVSRAGAEEVHIGADLTRGVVDTLDRIVARVDDTTSAAREISIVTDQQRAASDQVVAAMTQVAAVSLRYSAASRQAAESAAHLDALAAELAESYGRFKVV
jgi:methyl-accepting chemotaxis protein